MELSFSLICGRCVRIRGPQNTHPVVSARMRIWHLKDQEVPGPFYGTSSSSARPHFSTVRPQACEARARPPWELPVQECSTLAPQLSKISVFLTLTSHLPVWHCPKSHVPNIMMWGQEGRTAVCLLAVTPCVWLSVTFYWMPGGQLGPALETIQL